MSEDSKTILLTRMVDFLKMNKVNDDGNQRNIVSPKFKKDLIVDIACRGDFKNLKPLLFKDDDFVARNLIKDIFYTISSSRWKTVENKIQSCSATISPFVLKLLTNHFEEELVSLFLKELELWNTDSLNNKLIHRIKGACVPL
jgi:hypothetical protein